MWLESLFILAFVALAIYDLTQRKHAVLRNFPIIGHFRYWFEAIGPELRQYIVTSNNEERPFSRDQRRWLYSSSKGENNHFGFGTDNDLERSSSFLIIKHSNFPLAELRHDTADGKADYRLPCAKVLGAHRGRQRAFRPDSVVNISGMSFGSLSSRAIEALNRGAKLCGCLHNTGEGGLSPYHQHGGELIFQIGTAYFGCRDKDGHFSLPKLLEVVEANPIRALEIKISQGAKPGVGGMVPAAKITPELAAIRGIPMGRDCISPSNHAEFRNVDEMLDFVERLADATGLPVGIKSAVGDEDFWRDLVHEMANTARGVDFITIDGGEGGTGAAPLVFTDHVAFPFHVAFTRVYRLFADAGLHEQVVFIGSGRLGFPERALFAFALGCDLINVGREAMMAVGCIQAQRCHTNHCPTGVATQSRWLMRGLDPTLKAARLANYVVTLRKELLMVSRACGVPHPALVTSRQIEILDGRYNGATPAELFAYREDWGLPSVDDRAQICRIMHACKD